MNLESPNSSSLFINIILKNENSIIAELYRRGLIIHQLDQKLKEILDPACRLHFELANIREDIIVLLVDTSAWATRLRYNIPAILDICHKQPELDSIKTVRIKVRKPTFSELKTKRKAVYISSKTAKFLNESAKMFNDSKLRRSFKALSENYSRLDRD